MEKEKIHEEELVEVFQVEELEERLEMAAAAEWTFNVGVAPAEPY